MVKSQHPDFNLLFHNNNGDPFKNVLSRTTCNRCTAATLAAPSEPTHLRAISHMELGSGPAAPPPLPSELEAFKAIVVAAGKRQTSSPQQKFVKKLDSIPTVTLPVEETCRSVLKLAERGLIGQFTRLWPSPRAFEEWVKRN